MENVAYESRRSLASSEKQLIGRRAAALIPDNTSLFINIGTTTEEVARALVRHEGLLVVTNNIHVAAILSPVPKIEVIVVGGAVRKTDGGYGYAATDLAARARRGWSRSVDGFRVWIVHTLAFLTDRFGASDAGRALVDHADASARSRPVTAALE